MKGYSRHGFKRCPRCPAVGTIWIADDDCSDVVIIWRRSPESDRSEDRWRDNFFSLEAATRKNNGCGFDGPGGGPVALLASFAGISLADAALAHAERQRVEGW